MNKRKMLKKNLEKKMRTSWIEKCLKIDFEENLWNSRFILKNKILIKLSKKRSLYLNYKKCNSRKIKTHLIMKSIKEINSLTNLLKNKNKFLMIKKINFMNIKKLLLNNSIDKNNCKNINNNLKLKKFLKNLKLKKKKLSTKIKIPCLKKNNLTMNFKTLYSLNLMDSSHLKNNWFLLMYL